MALGEKVKQTLKEMFQEVADVLTTPVELAIAWGIERAVKRVIPNSYTYFELVIKMIESRPGSPSLKELVESGKLAELLNPPSSTPGHQSAPIYEAGVIDALSATGAIIGAPLGFLPFIMSIYEPGWGEMLAQRAREVSLPTLLSADEAIRAYFRAGINLKDLEAELAKGGLSAFRVDRLIKASRPLLSPDALRQLELRQDPEFTKVQGDLKQAGWTDERIAALKKLYWIIPGVQDLIRMAVREAFSPDIVFKYQLDADIPPQFMSYASLQGLSPEWAKNYWRAHWDLPSATQGFEMLHRGVISPADLDTLLRTLDVMPYWRGKLTQIAYSIPTRVDIRRIYNLGIRDRAWVKAQYIKLGYTDDDAEALTVFTTKTATSEDKDLTKADILSLFKKGVLDEETTREYLIDLDYSEEDVDYLIAKEATAAAEETRELSLTQIKSLALAGIIDKAQATTRMAGLGYTAEDIQKLYDLWTLEAPPQDALPSRTDLKNFYLAGIIDIDTWIDYMYQLRYSEEVIAWYYHQMTSEK